MELTAKNLISNQELLQKYEQWKDLPMTKMVIGIITREVARGLAAVPPTMITKSSAEMLYGEQVGSHFVLERLETLGNKQMDQEDVSLEPDYGAREILRKAGYKETNNGN